MDNDRRRLLELLKEKSFEQKRVLLSSGKESDFYIDCRQVTLHPEGAYLIGKIFYERISNIKIPTDGVGGMTMGADPMVSAIALTSFINGRPLPAFIVRKEQKSHGLGLWIEGKKNLKTGARVVIVEDVLTTGGSCLKAAERAEAEGLEVAKIIVLVDREEGGFQAVQEQGYDVESIFSRRDFIS